jgi:hypothetical protein
VRGRAAHVRRVGCVCAAHDCRHHSARPTAPPCTHRCTHRTSCRVASSEPTTTLGTLWL